MGGLTQGDDVIEALALEGGANFPAPARGKIETGHHGNFIRRFGTEMSDHACAMRENDWHGRVVESASHDGQVTSLVGMTPVQARMPVDQFEGVRRPRLRCSVVGVDKCP